MLNVDLAPTFLDMGGVPTPPHMDGRSILPLLNSRNRIVRDTWPDSFLIESSGRRETAEQIAESRARLLADRRSMKLVNSTLLEDLLGSDNSSSSSSTVATMLSSMATTTEQEDFEEDVDTDAEDEDGDDAIDSSAPAVDDEELVDVAAEEDEDDELDEQELLLQRDNNLPLAPYITKMMRLNSECSDPALLKNCLPGQKWKCVNEEGRWRKHKCKFHVSIPNRKCSNPSTKPSVSYQLQLEHQLATMPRKQYQRNCACFTSSGLVYTKIRAPTTSLHSHRLHKRTHMHHHHQHLGKRRHKRQVAEEVFHTELPYEMEELLDLDQSIDLLAKHGRRRKREASSGQNVATNSSNDAIALVIQQIQSTLETLELKFNEHELHNRSSSFLGRGNKFLKGGARCYVEESTDKVNCSDVIYDDEKTWRTSRNQIDMLIKLLKDKISTLKDMKKQMRENKQQAAAAGRRGEGRRRNDPVAAQEGAGPEFNMSYFSEIASTPRSVLLPNVYSGAGAYDSLDQSQPPHYASRAECYCEPDVGER